MTEIQQVVCPSCLAVNRVPSLRLSEDPLCGKCHLGLFLGQSVELTQSSFERFSTRNDIPIVVDFWAAWCGPCKTMAPAFEQAAQELEPSVRFAKVNTETENELAGRFNIRSIPTIVLFKNGHELARHSGAAGKNEIVQWIRGLL